MYEMFAVQTAHGTNLQVDRQTGRLWSGRPDASDAMQTVILYVPKGVRAVAFVLSPHHSGLRLSIGGDSASGRIIPLRLQQERQSSDVSLCHPFTGRFLSAIPPAADSDRGDVVIDRDERAGWELFVLLRLYVPSLPKPVTDILQSLEHWFERPLNGPSVLEILEEGLEISEQDAFDAYARLLPRDQIEWLGQTILGRPTAIANLAKAFPDDVFACQALPELRRWLDHRPRLTQRNIDPGLDGLAELGIDGQYTSLAHMYNAHARRVIPARKTIAILATARNEGIYILEWIAYHRSIGVEDFFIYSNDNSDGSNGILDCLAKAGVVNWINSEVQDGHAAQPKAYGHALGVVPNILEYRWTLTIDLDEFFAFDHNRFASIQEYIAWQETRPVDAVALNWLVYGSNGGEIWRDAPLLSRFPKRLPWIDKHIKTMVRTCLAMHSRPHHPAFDARQAVIVRNASGQPHLQDNSPSFSVEPEANTAWINHYFLKSAEEFLWKFSRNRGDHVLVRQATPAMIEIGFIEMFLKQHNSEDLVHDDRIAACASGQASEMGYLLSLPGVSNALRDVKHLYAEELKKLKQLINEDATFHVDGSPQNRLATLLGVARQ